MEMSLGKLLAIQTRKYNTSVSGAEAKMVGSGQVPGEESHREIHERLRFEEVYTLPAQQTQTEDNLQMSHCAGRNLPSDRPGMAPKLLGLQDKSFTSSGSKFPV